MGKEYKITLIGDQGAGKSTLTLRHIRNSFFEYQESTVGASYLGLNVSDPTKPSENIHLEIWDTSGNEKYRPLLNLYAKNAGVIILCVDPNFWQQGLTEQARERFNFIGLLKIIYDLNKHAPIIITVNKVDQYNNETQAAVKFSIQEELKKHPSLAKNVKAVIATSAKENYQVNDLFYCVIRCALKQALPERFDFQKESIGKTPFKYHNPNHTAVAAPIPRETPGTFRPLPQKAAASSAPKSQPRQKQPAAANTTTVVSSALQITTTPLSYAQVLAASVSKTAAKAPSTASTVVVASTSTQKSLPPSSSYKTTTPHEARGVGRYRC